MALLLVGVLGAGAWCLHYLAQRDEHVIAQIRLYEEYLELFVRPTERDEMLIWHAVTLEPREQKRVWAEFHRGMFEKDEQTQREFLNVFYSQSFFKASGK